MVIHDETRMQVWVQEQKKKKEKQGKQRKAVMHWSVVAVQSIACCVMVLAVLLLRVAGGESYESLRQHVRQALARNEWMTALSQVWQDKPLKNVENIEAEGVKVDDFTLDEPVQLTVSSDVVVAVPPLANGTLTSAYGQRTHPIYGGEEFHNGVDIAAPQGTALVAMYDGEVTEVGENDSIGRYLRLRHSGDVEVLYGHCESVTVRQGDTVRAGDTVAEVGSTGVSTGNHVHLGVKVAGVVCDPAALLSLERYA